MAGAVRRLLPFLFGAAMPFVMLTAWAAWAGFLDSLWFWTVTYAREYVALCPIEYAGAFLMAAIQSAILPDAALWLTGIVGLIVGLVNKEARSRAFLFTTWAVAGFLAAAPGFVFRGHYFLVLLPPVALASGQAFHLALARYSRGGNAQPAGQLALIGLFLALAVEFAVHGETWLVRSPDQVSRQVYGNQGFSEAVVVADFLRAHTQPSDQIAVLGSEPEICFLAGRRQISGTMYLYPMMEPHPFASRLQQEFIRELEAAAPRWVVFAEHQMSWGARPDSDRTILDWWQAYQTAHYEEAGFVDIEAAGTFACWQTEATGCRRKLPTGFTIYRRLN